jgi:hypothetical protein
MPRPNITRFANLAIDTSLDDGNPYKIMRCPRLTGEEKNDIPEDGLKGGEIIFNTESNIFELYNGTEWNSFPNIYSYRTGTVLVGDVRGPADPNLLVSGAITFASKADDVDQGNIISISYENLGYVPFIFVSTQESNNNSLYEPVVRNVNSSSAEIFYREPDAIGGGQNVLARVLLVKPDIE